MVLNGNIPIEESLKERRKGIMGGGGWRSGYEALAGHHSLCALELSNDKESESDTYLHPYACHNLAATRTSRLWLLVELLISDLCGAFIKVIGL